MATSPIWRYPQSVSSELLVPPAEEPFDLAEAKLRAGLDWPPGDPRDGLMTDFIAAARHKVELDTGLALLKQTRRVTMEYDPLKPVPLPMHALPLISITDAVGAAVTQYRIDRMARTIALASGYVSGDWIIESGWIDKATLKQEAPLLVQAVGLLLAHMATLGRDLASTEETFLVPDGYNEAIAPFVQIWVT